ncbi:MAG TPA: NAD-dependent epimerase/dehydratase family protein [bacterium]|nr:NAD-dependent epimerase/dehydratase family protein [bacterium]
MVIWRSTPTALVLGGTGHIGANIALQLARQGYPTTTVSRRPVDCIKSPIRNAFEQHGIQHHSIDVYGAENERPLLRLLEQYDLVINAAEPYPVNPHEIAASVSGVARLLSAAHNAGFGQAPKKWIRIGSPPAEIPNPTLSESDNGDRLYPENMSWGILRKRFHPAFSNPYFQTKLQIKQLFDHAVACGQIRGITVAPTAVVGWGADHGAWEPITNYFNRRFPPIIPAIPVDTIPVDHLAKGVVLAIEKGAIGEIFQLSGVHTNMADVILEGLKYAGMNQLPVSINLPRALWGPTLLGEVVMLRGFELFLTSQGLTPPAICRPMTPALSMMMGLRHSRKAQDQLGYQLPTEEDLIRAIHASVDWFRETGEIK